MLQPYAICRRGAAAAFTLRTKPAQHARCARRTGSIAASYRQRRAGVGGELLNARKACGRESDERHSAERAERPRHDAAVALGLRRLRRGGEAAARAGGGWPLRAKACASASRERGAQGGAARACAARSACATRRAVRSMASDGRVKENRSETLDASEKSNN